MGGTFLVGGEDIEVAVDNGRAEVSLVALV